MRFAGVSFFLTVPTIMRNMSPTQIFGIPNVGSHFGLLEIILAFFRLEVSNLQIL